MATSGSPMVQRRRLAGELRRLRTDAGRTAEDVGRSLGWSKAKVSRYELAQSGLKPADVARLLELYGVEGGHREQLLALAEEATRKGWWEPYADDLTEGHLAFIGLEAEAVSQQEWQVNVVPGLLQTEPYAREVLTGYATVATISPRAIRRRLQTRLIRQQVLTREQPLEYMALIDESILRRQRGDRSMMYEQLQRLVTAGELENVTVRVLPLRGDNRLAVDSFTILQFGDSDDAALHDVVSIDHVSNEYYIENDADAHQFRLAFQHLAHEALSPSDTRELILTTAEEVWHD